MGTNIDTEDAPPPYTPIDPLNSVPTVNNNDNNLTVNVVSIQELPTNTPAPNFISAAPYFRERSLPDIPRDHHEPLKHTLTVYKRSQAKYYTRFPRCWRSDSEELTQHDWDTFLGYLLPTHLGPAPTRHSHSHIPGRERGRTATDRTIESDEERRTRVASVVKEWNSCFFLPRGVMVVCNYARENGTSSASPLCPRCYPAAARSIPLRSASSPAGCITSTNPASGQMAFGHQPSPMTHRNSEQAHSSLGKYQWNPQVGPQSENPYGVQNGLGSWMWKNTENKIQNWANHISEHAAACGKRASEHAQQYGAMAQYSAQQHADYVQQQIKYAEGLAKWSQNHCSAWGSQWGFGGGGGSGGGWGDCSSRSRSVPWGQRQFQYGGGRERGIGISPRRESPLQRRSSSASSMSSCSSSSSSSDESLCSLGSAKGNIDRAEIAILRARIHGLREGKLNGMGTASDSRSAAKDIRSELRSLKLAHRNLRAVPHRRWGCGREIDKLEIQATKRELKSLKQEYRELVRRFRQEKREIRHRDRERRRERRKGRREDKKESKRISKVKRKGNDNMTDHAALAIRLGTDDTSTIHPDQGRQKADGM